MMLLAIIAFYIAVPLITIVTLFVLWFQHGRDPAIKNPVIAEYDAPESLSPLELMILATNKVEWRTLAAELIYLAQQGFLTIAKGEELRATWEVRTKNGNYTETRDFKNFILARASTVPERIVDKALLNALFYSKKTVELKEVCGVLPIAAVPESASLPGESAGSKFLDAAEAGVRFSDRLLFVANRDLAARGYFSQSGRKWYRVLEGTGLVMCVGPLFLAAFVGFLGSHFPEWFIASCMYVGSLSFIEGLIFVIAGGFFNVPSHETLDLRRRIKGFKLYLAVTDTVAGLDRSSAEFERQLSYALALGTQKEWAKEFDTSSATHSQDWYEPGHVGFLTASALTADMAEFAAAFDTVASTIPAGATFTTVVS